MTGNETPTPADGPDPAADPAAQDGAPLRRWRDTAILLPVFGTLLLMPPLIGLPVGPHRLFGIPLVVLYVFGIWAGLILVALLLCRARRRAGRAATAGPDRPSPTDPAA